MQNSFVLLQYLLRIVHLLQCFITYTLLRHIQFIRPSLWYQHKVSFVQILFFIYCWISYYVGLFVFLLSHYFQVTLFFILCEFLWFKLFFLRKILYNRRSNKRDINFLSMRKLTFGASFTVFIDELMFFIVTTFLQIMFWYSLLKIFFVQISLKI